MGKFRDLSVKEVGRLLVLSLNREKSNTRRKYWNCKCSCGNLKIISSDSLLSGKSKSCGCLRKEILTELHKTHGATNTREYNSYHDMKKRCLNSNTGQYINYGGRGIRICGSWLESFENFYADMGSCPSDKHSIERVDVNGDYTPENCIWADSFTQAANRRTHKDNSSGRCGVSYIERLDKYQVNIGHNNKSIYLGVYSDFSQACKVREEAELKYYGFIKN